MSADNTNTNFDRVRRKEVNNPFSKLNASLGKPVIEIGCVAVAHTLTTVYKMRRASHQ